MNAHNINLKFSAILVCFIIVFGVCYLFIDLNLCAVVPHFLLNLTSMSKPNTRSHTRSEATYASTSSVTLAINTSCVTPSSSRTPLAVNDNNPTQANLGSSFTDIQFTATSASSPLTQHFSQCTMGTYPHIVSPLNALATHPSTSVASPIFVSTMPQSSITSPFVSSSTAPSPSFIFTAPAPTPLKFSTADVPLWFQRFHARYRKLHLTDEELYYELLNCLEDAHLHRISHLIKHKPPSFLALKEALLQVYDIPAAQRQLNLSQIPGLGDRAPSELLNDLRVTLGKDDSADETAKMLLLSEFLNRMPHDMRHILRLFQDEPLDLIASKADALLQDRFFNRFSLSPSQPLQYMPGFSFQPPIAAPPLFHPPTATPSLLPAPLNSVSPRRPPRSSLLSSHHSSLPMSVVHQPPPNRISLPRFTAPVQPANRSVDRTTIINGLCYYHRNYPQNPHFCVAGCEHHNSLNSNGGVSRFHHPSFRSIR